MALGENAVGFEVGDRVAGEAWKGCGLCDNCVAGHYNWCENYSRPETGMRHYGFTDQGAYAQYNAYSVKSIHEMADNVSFQEGALVDTAGPGMHCMDMTGITTGGTIAVVGPGPIGLLTMRIARIRGASRVIVVGRGGRLEAARRLGADEVIDFTKSDPVAAVRTANPWPGGGRGFLNVPARAGTFAQAVMMVREGGKVGLLGVPDESIREPLPFKHICRNEITHCGRKGQSQRGRPGAQINRLRSIGGKRSYFPCFSP